MHKPRLWLIVTVLAVIVMITGAAYATATSYHATKGGYTPLCKSLDGSGNCVSPSTSEAYSPKASCARVCHSAETGRSGDFQHNYGSGDKMSTHVQGVLAGSDSKVYWEASQTKSFEHGVSASRHANQGRNEDYTNTFRAKYGDPFFTSSSGMFGKY